MPRLEIEAVFIVVRPCYYFVALSVLPALGQLLIDLAIPIPIPIPVPPPPEGEQSSELCAQLDLIMQRYLSRPRPVLGQPFVVAVGRRSICEMLAQNI